NAPTSWRWSRGPPGRSSTAPSATRWPPVAAPATRPPSARAGSRPPPVWAACAPRAVGARAGREVLMTGAAATAQLVARALVARGVDTVFVANRHHDRALGLAQRFDGEAIRFENLPEQLTQVDLA